MKWKQRWRHSAGRCHACCRGGRWGGRRKLIASLTQLWSLTYNSNQPAEMCSWCKVAKRHEHNQPLSDLRPTPQDEIHTWHCYWAKNLLLVIGPRGEMDIVLKLQRLIVLWLISELSTFIRVTPLCRWWLTRGPQRIKMQRRGRIWNAQP